MKTKFLRAPIKYHGGKRYLAKWILSQMPPDLGGSIYVEPFCGAANILFNKPPSRTEIINDLDKGTIGILRTIRDECPDLIKHLKKIPYTQESFQKALESIPPVDTLDFAINEFILRRMSRGGLKKAFAWSDRKRGGRPGDENAWLTMLELLPDLSERLQNVVILNKDAFEVIKKFNEPDVILYCDPPYLCETRTSKEIYDIELTTEQHIELATLLNAFTGKVLLSGYTSQLYNRLYKSWNCDKKKIANHASQSKKKTVKTEVLWRNF